MRINGFRCDGCGKEHLIDPSLLVDSYQFYRNIPSGWFIVTLGGNFDPHGEPLLFCSKECLRRHPLGREQLNSEQKDALSKERHETTGYLKALAELFEKEHPELRLTWSLTMDATLKETEPC